MVHHINLMNFDIFLLEKLNEMVDACLFSAVSTLSEFDEVANGKRTWRRFYCTSRKRSLVVVDVVYVLLLTSLHHARTFHFTSEHTDIYKY
jgi:hypothetical protein